MEISTLDQMKDLPGDIKRKIAMEFSPPDLISFCMINQAYNADVCDNAQFWKNKLEIDFPAKFNYFVKHRLVFVNPKNTYMKEFLYIGNEIDQLLNSMKYRLLGEAEKRKVSLEIYRMEVFKKIYLTIEEIDKKYNTYDDILNRLDALVNDIFGPVGINKFSPNVTRKLIERKSL